jgi:hypothetical protein
MRENCTYGLKRGQRRGNSLFSLYSTVKFPESHGDGIMLNYRIKNTDNDVFNSKGVIGL